MTYMFTTFPFFKNHIDWPTNNSFWNIGHAPNKSTSLDLVAK
jgi:hypothetical protein